MASRAKDQAPDRDEEDAWVDVYALHFPPETPRGHFDRGVGNEGYDRGTGAEVPKHPRLVRPGDKEPEADPFGPDEGH